MKLYVLTSVVLDCDYLYEHKVLACSTDVKKLQRMKSDLCRPLADLKIRRSAWRQEFSTIVRDFFARNYDQICSRSRADWQIQNNKTGYESSHAGFIARDKQAFIEYIACHGFGETFRLAIIDHMLGEHELPNFPLYPMTEKGMSYYEPEQLFITEEPIEVCES